MGDHDTEGVRGWWVLAGLVPFGTPAGFLYAAHRSGTRRWYAWAAVWAVLWAVSVVMANTGPEDGALATGGSVFLVGVWLGGLTHGLAVRRDYVRQVTDPEHDPVEAARSRLQERERAKELARADPELARELGVGRPELPGAQAMGVVDLNHASAEALTQLPGVDAQLAGRLVAVREEMKGFVSVEDAGVVLDLDTTTVDRLSRQAVFLPF